jgi:hypothetical protein
MFFQILDNKETMSLFRGRVQCNGFLLIIRSANSIVAILFRYSRISYLTQSARERTIRTSHPQSIAVIVADAVVT